MTCQKAKNIIINLSLLAGVFILCLVFFEMAVRSFFPSPQHQAVFEETIGHKRQPNSLHTIFVSGEKIENNVNSMGFMDEEHSAEKPAGVYRILFLGDSMTEAVRTHREKTFPKVLETELNQIHQGKIEVINLSISGFGTANEYLTLKKYGLNFSPDLTILVFTVANDLADNYYKTNTSFDPAFDVIDGQLVQIRTPQPLKGSKIREFLSDNLQFPRFLIHQLSKIAFLRNFFIEANFISATKTLPNEQGLPFDSYLYIEDSQDMQIPWRITRALISEIDEVLKDSQSDFLVVILPSMIQHDAQERELMLAAHPQLADFNLDFALPQRTLKDYLEEQDIKCLDVLGQLQEAEEFLYYLPEDGGHYNPSGHKLITKVIFNYFQETDLIKIK